MADYGSLLDHADEMLALLYASDDLTVYPAPDGGPSTVPDGAEPPYVSVHFVADRPDGGRLDGKSTRMKIRAYAHCVGANDIAARAVSDLVADAWLDVRTDIPGRSKDRIKFEQSREADPTEPVARTTVTITDIYTLDTGPGADGS